MKNILIVLTILFSIPGASNADMLHRFLVYGDGDVMISDFDYLPKKVLVAIDKIVKTKNYGTYDFTEYLPEILESYRLVNYKGITGSREIQFKFSRVTLVHNLDKGDCHNYPDTFLSLKSNDFKRIINGKEYTGYPDEPFLVVPTVTKLIRDKASIKELFTRLKNIYNSSPLYGQPSYYKVENRVYAVIELDGMGVGYDVYDCTEGCKRLNYPLGYPPCGS